MHVVPMRFTTYALWRTRTSMASAEMTQGLAVAMQQLQKHAEKLHGYDMNDMKRIEL